MELLSCMPVSIVDTEDMDELSSSPETPSPTIDIVEDLFFRGRGVRILPGISVRRRFL